jgi:hypothetical protein
MPSTFPTDLDSLAAPSGPTVEAHPTVLPAVSLRQLAAGILLAATFLSGFTAGALAGSVTERTVIEPERTLW